MRTAMTWVFAATLICGATVFTSCSSDSSDYPVPLQTKVAEPAPATVDVKKDREVFIEHTRAAMKGLLDNMNFSSWENANQINNYFNKDVLVSSGFIDAMLDTAFEQIIESAKEVEEGSALAEMGFEQYSTINLTTFNYSFTMKDDNKSFDIVESEEGLEIIVNAYNFKTGQIENGAYKLAINNSGVGMTQVIPSLLSSAYCYVIMIPKDYEFTLSTKVADAWIDVISGVINFQLPVGATDLSKGWMVDATFGSPILSVLLEEEEETLLNLSVAVDKVNGQKDATLSLVKDDVPVFEVSLDDFSDYIGGIFSNFDFSEFTSSSSILDVIAALFNSSDLEEAKVTLFNDLTTTISVSDMSKALKVAHKSAKARLNNADQQTIDNYTQQLNELITLNMTSKSLGQTIPMRLETVKLGNDWLSLPSLKFADEDTYVPLTQLMDQESLQNGLDAIDYASVPMQQSIDVTRQLIQLISSFANLSSAK